MDERPAWPAIVLVTPKGWTGPKTVDGLQTEGSFRSHQVPFSEMTEEHVRLLEDWMQSYRPEELFDERGALRPELADLAPQGAKRMGANPHANGGLCCGTWSLPDFRDFAVKVPAPGAVKGEATKVMGAFLAEVMRRNLAAKDFRVFGPDETRSNRLDAVLEVTPRTWNADLLPGDDKLSPTGRVMEILSEHTIQGWVEGYLLTGRHALFSCYEAFIHIVSSMFNQYAKWLDVCEEIPWRRPVPSLNYLLDLARLATGPQRLLASGPGLHRPRAHQEGLGDAGLPAARRELPAVCHRQVPAQPQPGERDSRRQAAGASVAGHGLGHQALHRRHRDLGVGWQRCGQRARRGHGLRRRRAHHGDPGGGGLHAQAPARPQGAGW